MGARRGLRGVTGTRALNAQSGSWGGLAFGRRALALPYHPTAGMRDPTPAPLPLAAVNSLRGNFRGGCRGGGSHDIHGEIPKAQVVPRSTFRHRAALSLLRPVSEWHSPVTLLTALLSAAVWISLMISCSQPSQSTLRRPTVFASATCDLPPGPSPSGPWPVPRRCLPAATQANASANEMLRIGTMLESFSMQLLTWSALRLQAPLKHRFRVEPSHCVDAICEPPGCISTQRGMCSVRPLEEMPAFMAVMRWANPLARMLCSRNAKVKGLGSNAHPRAVGLAIAIAIDSVPRFAPMSIHDRWLPKATRRFEP
mmetsp:Transcript_57890/g.114920  ORF Transcript_57890/g.114920 Transcript_57890/m.114920 type:complete len:312 (+) Transcript_57890:262-1197(+)